MSENKKTKHTPIEREEAIFTLAVEADDAADRQSILDRECASDANLRQRVDALLAAHDAEGSLPAVTIAVPSTRVPEALAGEVIAGKYKLLEEIGVGGMGVVWMAEQRQPVRRTVAVKLIKAGMDSRTVIIRFEAERQALAMMDHPNIARVFDGGMTEQGRPFFVMELVRGLTVTQYCDQRRMTIPDRLRLFVNICHAVQHAHQKGVIHRDLKPSNVLVTEHDGKPVAKVIDFGLAKALGGGGILTDNTLYTAFGAMVGTPLYTAPEQVAINALDIDTRADIYALGVMLYELLTGTTPVEQKRLREAAWDEICRVIREEEPLRPSLRVSTSAILPNLAASRQIEPAKLSGLIKGDLDWIVLKALEKERSRRYDTANGVAADIERHLNNEPVLAAPPSVVYRSRKFIQKHAIGMGAVALVVLALGFGVVTTTWQWYRANAANSELHKTVVIAKDARDNAEAQKQTAELEAYVANLALAQNAIAAQNWTEARSRLIACQKATCGWEWRFLQKQTGNGIYSLPAGTSIHGFNRDGTRMLTSDGTTIRVQDSATGACIGAPIRDGAQSFWDCELNSDGTKVITLGMGLVAAGYQLQWWDAITGNKIGNPVSHVAGQFDFNPDGKRVAATYDRGTRFSARIWDLAAGTEACPPMPHPADVLSIAFNPAGTRLLTSCSDHCVRIWDASTGALIGEPFKYDGDLDTLVFSPDGSRILLASVSKPSYVLQLSVLSADTLRPLFAPLRFEPNKYARGVEKVENGVSSIESTTKPALAFSADSKRIMLGWHDATESTKLRMWDAMTGVSLGEPIDIDSVFQTINIVPGHDLLLTQNDSSLWTTNGTRVGRADPRYTKVHSPNGKVVALSINTDNGAAAATSLIGLDRFDSAIDVLDAGMADLEIAAAMEDAGSHPTGTTFPAGQIISLAQDGFVDIVGGSADARPRRIGSSDDPVRAFAMSADGTRLVTGNASSIRFYDTQTWRELAVFRQVNGVKRLVLTPDGTRLGVEFANGSAQIWDTRPVEDRRRMWNQLADERPTARLYVKKLFQDPAKGDDWLDAIRKDPALTPVQKIVTLQVAGVEISRIDAQARPAFSSLETKLLSKSPVVKAINQESDLLLRTRMLQLAAHEDWMFRTTHLLWSIVDRDDASPESYQQAAAAADDLMAMNPETATSISAKTTVLDTIGAAYYHVGRYEDSLAANRRALVLNVEHNADNEAFSQARIAMAEFNLGQRAEARAALASAIAAAEGSNNSNLPGVITAATKLIDPSVTQPASDASTRPAP